MYISSKQILGAKLYDHDGHFIARIRRVIINPDTGHILAFLLYSGRPNLISPQDIVSWKQHYLSLSQNYELHYPADLVRLHKLYTNHCTDLLKRRVRTESGFKMGKIIEYSLNTKSFSLASITTQKSFFGLFPGQTFLIHHTAIVDIKPREVIVKDSLLKLPLFQNTPGKFALSSGQTFDSALSEPESRTSF